MARDASGTYTLPLPPVVVDTPIDTTWANPSFSDFEAEFSDSLSRSGKGGMSAALKLVAGTISAPAWSFSSETNTGVYRNAAGDIRFSVLGVDVARWSATYGFQMYVAASWVSPTTTANSRELLTANRTYYVRTDGSNSNTGLTNSAGGAFLTIQKALNVVGDTLDLGGYVVTIQVGDGTYTAGAVVPQFTGATDGPANVILLGNTTTPANCVISTAGDCILAATQTGITIKGFKLVSSGGYGLNVYFNSIVQVYEMNYGACVGDAHIACFDGGRVYINANYTISGNSSYHFSCDGAGSMINSPYDASFTVTLTGTPAFNGQFVVSYNLGEVFNRNTTWSGSATGVRYTVEHNAIIDTQGGGASYFPGNSAGVTSTGGIYT